MSIVSYVRIPCDISQPLETLELDLSVGQKNAGGDQLPNHLIRNIDPDRFKIEVVPLKRMSPFDPASRQDISANNSGVYAYLFSSATGSELDRLEPNVRATCLSMACGLHSQRFYGDIYISRLGYHPFDDAGGGFQLGNSSLTAHEIQFACQTPDLRVDIIAALDANSCKNDIILPVWLTDAAKSNYEDAAALSILASVMKKDKKVELGQGSSELLETSAGESGYESDIGSDLESSEQEEASKEIKKDTKKSFVTKQPLCMSCRQPSENLCPDCNSMYFCPIPRLCKTGVWSHQALCKTWALYCSRRDELGSFPFEEWHLSLLDRQNQISEEPYKNYLMHDLGVLKHDQKPNWWSTEISGWCGGLSDSAKRIDFIKRISYQEGFALDNSLLPPERPVTIEDCTSAGISREPQCNLLKINSWEEYYNLRGVPLRSPVALLLTFPLTIHHAILKHGAVPITVAKMLNRQLRIHVVGIEKELNFLDLFKELAFLLPEDLKVELLFIVRQDMLPETCNEYLENGVRGLRVDLAPNLTILVQSGTYNETMDPNFDCGTGPPDMVIGLNAGLFAYESWRNVIEYLQENRGIVGVFTDYNEHSGVNCASLGGGKARESLEINPFRQPHALPVYSMNLPQFSNGFMYVFNEQELDI